MISLSIADGVAEVVLDAPHKLNSLDEQALADLSTAYDDAADAAARGEVRALLLRGEGRGFCAGRDIAGVTPETTTSGYLGGLVAAAAAEDDAPSPRPPSPRPRAPCLGVGLGLLHGHGRGVRGGERQVRLPVRQPGRHPGFGRALVLHRAPRHAPDPGPDLHRRTDERRRGGGAGPVQPRHARGRAAGDHPRHRRRGSPPAPPARSAPARNWWPTSGTSGWACGSPWKRKTPARRGCARARTTPKVSGPSRRSASPSSRAARRARPRPSSRAQRHAAGAG